MSCLRLPHIYLVPESLLSLQIPNVEPVKLVISGPSGVGKDAIVKALQAARPDLHFVITATSRYLVSSSSTPSVPFSMLSLM